MTFVHIFFFVLFKKKAGGNIYNNTAADCNLKMHLKKSGQS